MASQALVEFRTILLHPTPYGRVVGLQTTFLEQLFDIAQRKRVPKIPAHRTQNKLRLGLPPFEDRRPGRHFRCFQATSSTEYDRCNTTGLGGATMPGKGKSFSRSYSPAEKQALSNAVTMVGEATMDIFLNERVCWQNVPSSVWEYTISGYAVIKKWLSYREKNLLGRSLTVEEARYVTGMARRIAALLLMSPSLNENYIKVTEVVTPLNF